MSALSRFGAALGAGALLLILTACAPTVALQPAEDAASPDCAPVSVRLPDEIGGLPGRETNAQATGAWGDPVAVILHCGVAIPAPTAELPCYTIDGIDWLVDPADAPNYVFTTYGREPAVSVVVDSEVASGRTVIEALSSAVSWLPSNGRACISVEDADLLQEDAG
jgi:hypothetical protein